MHTSSSDISRRNLLRAGLGLGAGALLVGCGTRGGGTNTGTGDNKVYTIKFSHVVTAKTPKGQAAEKFKEVVESKSNGRVTVEIYPNSELYGDKDELQALQSGSVQVLAPSSAKFTTIAPQLQVLDLPYLFRSAEDIDNVLNPTSAVGKAIYDNTELAKRSIKVMGLWDNGFKQLSSNKTLANPADLKGQKFRIQPSDVLKSQFEAWGAQPTAMAFSEVYNAMQQGVIDGGENPWSNIESQKMHTVQKHIVESNHGYLGYVLVINKPFLYSLPADMQAVVTEAAKEATDFNRKIAFEVNAASKQKIVDAKTSEISVHTPEQREAFRQLVVPSVWNKYADVIGKDLVTELLKQQG